MSGDINGRVIGIEKGCHVTLPEKITKEVGVEGRERPVDYVLGHHTQRDQGEDEKIGKQDRRRTQWGGGEAVSIWPSRREVGPLFLGGHNDQLHQVLPAVR